MNPRDRLSAFRSVGMYMVNIAMTIGFLLTTLACQEGLEVSSNTSESSEDPVLPEEVVEEVTNEPPRFEDDEVERFADHGALPGTAVGEPIPAAIDPEGDELTYSIRYRNDTNLRDKLSIDELQVMTAEEPRFNASPSQIHYFTITADDGNGGTATTTLKLRISIPSDAITFPQYEYFFTNVPIDGLNDPSAVLATVAENTPLVDGVSYSLTGEDNDKDLFEIDGQGRITSRDDAVLAAATTYSFDVTGTQGSRSGTTSVRLRFNSPPVFTAPAAFSVYENDQRGGEPGYSPLPESANMLILDLGEHVSDADDDEITYEILQAWYKVDAGDNWTNQGSLVYVYRLQGDELRKVGGSYFYYDRISSNPRVVRERRVRIRATDSKGARTDFNVSFAMRDVNDHHSTITDLYQVTLPIPYNATNGYVITNSVYNAGSQNYFRMKDIDTIGSFTNGQTTVPRGNGTTYHIAWDDDEDNLETVAAIYTIQSHSNVFMFGTTLLEDGDELGELHMQLVVTNTNFIAGRDIGDTFTVYFASSDGISHAVWGILNAQFEIVNEDPTFDLATYSREIAANHNVNSYVLSMNAGFDALHVITATDPEGDTITFSIVDNSHFVMNANDNRIYRKVVVGAGNVAAPVPLTQGETYEIEVVATDGGGASVTNTYEVEITVNQLPSFAQDTYTRTIDANFAVGSFVFSFNNAHSSDPNYVSATDPENEWISYSLADNLEFRMFNQLVYRKIDSFGALIPLNPGQTYSLTVTATDAQGGTATATLEVAVSP